MIDIRRFQNENLSALVTLINEADTVDGLERATTLREMEHEMSFPSYHAETDCFLAWKDNRLVGYADLYVAKGNRDTGSTIYCSGVVHPQLRRRGLGRRLLETAFARAAECLDEIEDGQVNFQGSRRDVEEDRKALYEEFGMSPVRYWVNLARPIGNGLPPVNLPAGIRLRTFDPESDAETVWQVDNTAFRDHWNHTGWKLEDLFHWIKMPHFRPELWFLAEEEATCSVVGIGLNVIDPDWIAQTGRQEGCVDTLAVLREHRHRGLGTALLAHSLHVLRQEGMEAAHLHADAENLTGAMRLYERVGFQIRKTQVSHRKVLRAQ